MDNLLTLDDLRGELRAFAREVLRKDMSEQLEQTSTAMLQNIQKFMAEETSDVQRMLEELSHKLLGSSLQGEGSPAHENSLRRIGDSGCSGAAKHVRMSMASADFPAPPVPPSAVDLPGAVDASGTDEAVLRQESCKTEESSPSSPKTPKVMTTTSSSWTRSPKPQVMAHNHALARKESDSLKPRMTEATSAIRTSSLTSKLQLKCIDIVTHMYFDYFTASLILLNGALVGVQIDVMARNDFSKSPFVFEVLEIVFCVFFTGELGIRLIAYRLSFFTARSQRGWNVFDFCIVSVQLIELLMNAVASGLGFNFNVLRVLRLFRIIRLARALRLIGQLRTIVSSIIGSLKPLGWSAVLLFIMIYVVAIIFTQAVHTKKIDWHFNDIPDGLDFYWGSLSVSILSLFEAVTGGLDWNDACRPLFDYVGTEVGLFFCAYVLFTVFATLNVVTGVFIDSVMTHASHEKEQHTIQRVLSLFSKLDIDHSGEITWAEFESHLNMKEMRDFFKTIDVNVENAESLFQLLDLDNSGSVNVCEFMDGCLRIWAPARGLDLRMILREVNLVIEMVQGLLHGLTMMNPEFDFAMGKQTTPDGMRTSINSYASAAPRSAGQGPAPLKCIRQHAINAVWHPEAKDMEDFYGEENDDGSEGSDLEPEHNPY